MSLLVLSKFEKDLTQYLGFLLYLFACCFKLFLVLFFQCIQAGRAFLLHHSSCFQGYLLLFLFVSFYLFFAFWVFCMYPSNKKGSSSCFQTTL